VGEKPHHYWYPILIIFLCIQLVLRAAISFRAAPKAIHTAFSHFIAVKRERIPSYKTVSRWLVKVGLYKLKRLKEKAKDWALFVDHSVQIGTQKCLVILGTRLSKFQGKALTFEDMEILEIRLQESSNREELCQILEEAEKKVGKAAMVCADDGSDLRGGIALFCEKQGAGRVFDIVHKLGTILKKFLDSNAEWQGFCSEAAAAKKEMQQSKAAHLAPPNQRTKCRFLNTEILVGWGVDVLEALNTPGHCDKELLEESCGWVREYADHLEYLKQLMTINQKVRNHVRERGLRKRTGYEVEKMLERLDLVEEACQYAGEVIDFLKKQSKIVPLDEVWVGTSEVLESVFGKLKDLEGDQSKGGFTTLVLGVAACVGKVDLETVKKAMEETSTEDVKRWGEEQLGVTLLSRRRKALGFWRKKRKRRKVDKKKVGQHSTGILLGKVAGF
jgi:hypothetical protein